MEEYMDFFDALREVMGTDKLIFFQPLQKSSTVKFNIRHYPNCWLRDADTGEPWWPTPEHQKEKVWQVEPAPEELVDFQGAFAAAMDGAEIAPEECAFGFWVKYYVNDDCDTVSLIAQPSGCWWWPTPEQIKGKWRIRKEKKGGAVTIICWGACDDDGTSQIYFHKPIKRGGDWIHSIDDNNLFPKDKPQKFKLVPVDD